MVGIPIQHACGIKCQIVLNINSFIGRMMKMLNGGAPETTGFSVRNALRI